MESALNALIKAGDCKKKGEENAHYIQWEFTSE